MSLVGEILGAVGGQQGIAAGAADIIGAVKGTNVPQSVTYNQAPQNNSPSPVLLIGGAVVVMLIFFMVSKQ